MPLLRLLQDARDGLPCAAGGALVHNRERLGSSGMC